MKLQVGDVIYIQSYKHDGSLHRTWSSATVLDDNDDVTVVITYKTWVVEYNDRKWFTKEPAICFYYKKKWFNIIAMIRQKGVFYYCNLASPSIYDGEALKNIDYDLDIKVFPDGKSILLDEDEFRLHQRLMDYSTEVIDTVVESKDELQEMVDRQEGPFKEKIIYSYFDKYLHLDKYAK